MRSSVHYFLLSCLITVAALSMNGCTTDDTDDTNPCYAPSLSLTNNQSSVTIQVSSAHGYYEVQYGGNGFTLGSGTVATVNAYHTLGNLNNGAYDIYIRGNCGGTSWSDWTGPTSFLITGGSSGSCPAPYSFTNSPSVSQVYLDWMSSSSASYFHLEYGLTGFVLGTGQSVNVPYSMTTLTGLSSNTVYDYYIRSNCGGSDFSAWTGPHSFVTQ